MAVRITLNRLFHCRIASARFVWMKRRRQTEWLSLYWDGEKEEGGRGLPLNSAGPVELSFLSAAVQPTSVLFGFSSGVLGHSFSRYNPSSASSLPGILYRDVRSISRCCSLSSDECSSLAVQEPKGIAPYQTFRSDKAPSKERRETLSRVLQGSADQR